MIIALVHDIVITVGIYALVGREVSTSTVAAILTVLGYSIYDTIIIFDRMRENMPLMKRSSFRVIGNVSLWETIPRSLATTFITLLPIASLFFFGGDTLKDFAFALLIGIGSGAYSSIFIAAPLLAMFKEREPEYARRRDDEAAWRVTCRSEARSPWRRRRSPRPTRSRSSQRRRLLLRQRRRAPSASGAGSGARHARTGERGRPPVSEAPGVDDTTPERGLVEQLLFAGIGWASLTAETADHLADDLARRVGVERDEMRSAVRDALTSWRREAGRLGVRRGEALDHALARLGLVRREEHDDLVLRVAQLEHRLKLLEREL